MNTFGQKNLIFTNGLKSAISAKILIRTTANFCPNLENEFKVGYFYFIVKKKLTRFCFPEFDCPIDGTCSGQGTCDDTTGTCVCNEGYEGVICKGN